MPLVVRHPKTILAGTESDAIVENIDLPALMFDYAGVPTPDYMHGRSFRTILETGEEPADWKPAAYYHPGHAGVIADLKAQLKALRKQYGEDDPKFACNQVIDAFWDYGPEAKARAIEISHTYLKAKQQNIAPVRN